MGSPFAWLTHRHSQRSTPSTLKMQCQDQACVGHTVPLTPLYLHRLAGRFCPCTGRPGWLQCHQSSGCPEAQSARWRRLGCTSAALHSHLRQAQSRAVPAEVRGERRRRLCTRHCSLASNGTHLPHLLPDWLCTTPAPVKCSNSVSAPSCGDHVYAGFAGLSRALISRHAAGQQRRSTGGGGGSTRWRPRRPAVARHLALLDALDAWAAVQALERVQLGDSVSGLRCERGIEQYAAANRRWLHANSTGGGGFVPQSKRSLPGSTPCTAPHTWTALARAALRAATGALKHRLHSKLCSKLTVTSRQHAVR